MSDTSLPYSVYPDASILQSAAWAQFQQAIGHSTVEQSGAHWHWMAIQHKRRYGSYLDLPYGPTIGKKSAIQPAITTLIEEAKKIGAVFVRIEPIGEISEEDLKQFGAVKAEKNTQPQHSSVIDLNLPLAELRAALNKGRKSALNSAVKQEVGFEECKNPEDIKDFLEMIHITYQRTHIRAHADEHYIKTMETLMPLGIARLFYATHSGKRVAGVISFDSPTTRYYIHAASLPEARDLEAASFLVWQIIVNAKERALKSFDFFGIAPPNEPNHPWVGFTHFKKSFGGTDVTHIGTWEIPVKSSLYHALRSAKKLHKLIKK